MALFCKSKPNANFGSTMHKIFSISLQYWLMFSCKTWLAHDSGFDLKNILSEANVVTWFVDKDAEVGIVAKSLLIKSRTITVVIMQESNINSWKGRVICTPSNDIAAYIVSKGSMLYMSYHICSMYVKNGCIVINNTRIFSKIVCIFIKVVQQT